MRLNPVMTFCAAAVVASPIARAQDASVGLVSIRTNHEIMARPLTGVGVAVRVPIGEGRNSVRIQVETVTGTSERFAIPCAGLVQPASCEPETIRSNARMAGAEAGILLGLLSRQHFRLALSGDVVVTHVEVQSRGIFTGNGSAVADHMWGPLAGAEATVKPFSALPLSVELSAGIGGLIPIRQEDIADGYKPFDHGFRIRRFHIAAAWQFGTRR